MGEKEMPCLLVTFVRRLQSSFLSMALSGLDQPQTPLNLNEKVPGFKFNDDDNNNSIMYMYIYIYFCIVTYDLDLDLTHLNPGADLGNQCEPHLGSDVG